MTVRFDEAWSIARQIGDEASRAGVDVVVIRDLLGRCSLALGGAGSVDQVDSSDPRMVPQWAARLREALGKFAAPEPAFAARDLLSPRAVVESPDLVVVRDRVGSDGRLALLELGVTGADWTRVATDVASQRVTLYGFKGGVGRSTAAFMLAQHLADSGKCVLVVDLDLESPGVGALLRDEQQLPEHGLLDYLVEASVRNEADLDLVTLSSSGVGNGEVWLAPVAGRPRDGYEFLSKLNRAYLDLPLEGRPPLPFRDRLSAAVKFAEDDVARRSRAPEVVLLDSRAGIHDVAAVALTQLADHCLLFAADSGQTWSGYRALFQQWGRSPSMARLVRERLKMVAPMAPSSPRERDQYLRQYRDHAQACFADTLYDSIEASSNDSLDAFNPAPDDLSAPHAPLVITFTPDLVGLDAAAQRDWPQNTAVVSAYDEFLTGADEFISTTPSVSGE